jgi:hypothetical protein
LTVDNNNSNDERVLTVDKVINYQGIIEYGKSINIENGDYSTA